MSPTDWIEAGTFALRLLEGVSALGVGVVSWMHWSLRREMVTKGDLARYRAAHDDAHAALNERLAEGEKQFTAIKADIEHLPDHHDLKKIEDRIGAVDRSVVAVEGSVKELSATMRGLDALLRRIETPLNQLVEHHMTVPK